MRWPTLGAPFVTVVEAAEPGQGDDLGVANGPGLPWVAHVGDQRRSVDAASCQRSGKGADRTVTKHLRFKDMRDFDAAAPTIAANPRAWLTTALEQAHSGHPRDR